MIFSCNDQNESLTCDRLGDGCYRDTVYGDTSQIVTEFVVSTLLVKVLHVSLISPKMER